MDHNMIIISLLFATALSVLQVTKVAFGLETLLEEKDEIDLRRELDKLTQKLLVDKDPFYHSYVFNSGVGNREKLVVDWMREDSHFTAGKDVISWQAVRNRVHIHLLGRKPSSVSLVTAAAQLSSNRTVQVVEHSVDFDTNVTSTSLFTRWNPATSKPEVVAVVAIDSPAADVLFYRVIDGKLEYITQWSRYRKVGSLTAVSVDGRSQLIIIDARSPTSVDVFDVVFTPDIKLDIRLIQSFAVEGECRSSTICRVGEQYYLVLPLPQQLIVYRLVSGLYQRHTVIPYPHISQVVTFKVALQTYLAVNGETARVLRLTESGEFFSELMPGHVSEWMVLPVSSYRSDVLLLSRSANITTAYVWAGANRGFDTLNISLCESCLDGHWSGAVPVPFQHQNCLLIPRTRRSSSLVVVGTSMSHSNPVLDKLKAIIANINTTQHEWEQIKFRIAELEKTLRYVLKRNGTNVITGKWTMRKLESPAVVMNSVVRLQSSDNVTEEAGLEQLETLESAVEGEVTKGIEVINAVEQREKEAWGLTGFRGKVIVKGQLIVDDLTVSHLNNMPVDDLLHNTFRKDKPERIEKVVVEQLDAEDIVFNKIKNFTSDDFKFSDGPVVVSGDLTLEHPLTVRGAVELGEGGTVSGLDLSKELCHGLGSCSVFPPVEEEVRNNDFNSNVDNYPTTSFINHVWNKTVAGRNLTVMKINGVDWKTLTQNVVYLDTYQNIIGPVIVNGTVSSPAIWAGNIRYLHKSQSRASHSDRSSPGNEESRSGKMTTSDSSELVSIDELPDASEVILSELEVTGRVLCDESEWGTEAADVVLGDVGPIVIQGEKTFSGAVNVTNNAELKGSVGGVVVSDLLTADTEQVFADPTTLRGDVTLDNVTTNGNMVSYEDISGSEIIADSINVLKTLNGVPVSEIVFTDADNVTRLKAVDADRVYVTKDIVVKGKVGGVYLDDFDEKRLSMQKEQNISGMVVIKKAKITSDFQVKKLNDLEMSSLMRDYDDSEFEEALHLSELHIDGDIVTKEGVNGFNLTRVAADAVWLEGDNEIAGPLVFEDEVTFKLLQSQGYCNNQACDFFLNFDDVVFKNNKSVIFSGKKRFINSLNISEDLRVQEVNSQKIENILTKSTEQEIAGDLVISGDVRIAGDSSVLGLLNGQNMTEFGRRCSLSENTITCKGNAVFQRNVTVDHFNTSGKINNVKFETFLKSIVRTDDPQQIKDIKRFTGNVVVENIEDVVGINGVSWDDFLSDSVTVDGQEQVDHPVTFSNTLTMSDLSVDYHMEADTINEVNVTNWKTDAVYINQTFTLKREIRLASSSSRGNLTVDFYGNLDLQEDVFKLHQLSSLPSLNVKSVTVLGDVEVMGLVNMKSLVQLERNTLKTSGDQEMESDLIVQGEVVIHGDLNAPAAVNRHNLSDVVTLASDQVLHGKYMFDCIKAQGNVSSSQLISGINLTSWTQTGVLKDGREQVISGVWRVQGPMELKGPVTGKGRLGDVDLQRLTDDITRNVLDVHRQMKTNLTEACEEANAQLASARSQPVKLLYLDVTQTLQVPAGPSLVTHFQKNDEDFLAISENSCITKIYKWNKNTGKFLSISHEIMGFSLKKFIILNFEHFTYLVTESSKNLTECEHSGKNLWVFMDDHFKHISKVNFLDGDLRQGEGNSLYVVNPSGVLKNSLHFDNSDGRAFFKSKLHRSSFTTDIPMEFSGTAQYEWLSDIYASRNCSGEVDSVSVDPDGQFVAVATSEVAEVPKPSSYIKVYRQDGRLFDKLPAQNVNQLHWLAVPSQTWLVALQNDSTLNLYQLQGPLLGFQIQVSTAMDAVSVKTLVLPLVSKVNQQPFVIIQTPSMIKIVRAFIQGDPYRGNNLSCSFDQVLKRVPRN